MSQVNGQYDQAPIREAYDGLEVVAPPVPVKDEEGKQVAGDDGKQTTLTEGEYYSSKMPSEPRPPTQHPSEKPAAPATAGYYANAEVASTTYNQTPVHKPWWKRKRWWIIAVIALIIIIVAIVVPVVVTQNKGSGSETTPASASTGTSPSPGAQTTVASQALPQATGTYSGIIERSRIAQAGSSANDVDHVTFYQAGDGSLRYIPLTKSTKLWQGPNSNKVDVDDAMPGSPITATNALINGTNYWYLFYVDKNQNIQAVYKENANENGNWKKMSPIGLKVPKDPSIGFTLGWGRKYNESIGNGLDGGLSLYVTGVDGFLHEHIYKDKKNSWANGFKFGEKDGSGGAVFGFLSYQDGTAEGFTVTKGRQSSMNFYTRDYTKVNQDTWNLQLTSPGGYPASDDSAVCTGVNHIVYQAPDGQLMVGNFTGSTPSEFQWNRAYVAVNSDEKPLNGTGLGCWYNSGGNGILFSVLYQTQDGGIKEAKINWGDDIDDYTAWQHEEVLTQSS